MAKYVIDNILFQDNIWIINGLPSINGAFASYTGIDIQLPAALDYVPDPSSRQNYYYDGTLMACGGGGGSSR